MKKAKYLGEQEILIKKSVYRRFTPTDWSLYFIEKYGGIEGDHHKAWVLDQVARVLNGMVPKIKWASWDDGLKEYRISLHEVEPTKEYLEWVAQCKKGEDGSEIYDYNEGIAP